MTEILDRPFDLVTECKTSISGNKDILTIIDHLTGWPEAFPVPDKSADTIVSTSLTSIYQSTCAPSSSHLTMAQNSRIISWTKY